MNFDIKAFLPKKTCFEVEIEVESPEVFFRQIMVIRQLLKVDL